MKNFYASALLLVLAVLYMMVGITANVIISLAISFVFGIITVNKNLKNIEHDI